MAPRIIHLPAPPSRLRRVAPRRWVLALTVPLVLALIALVSGTRPAAAGEAPVNLRTTASFAVLASSTVKHPLNTSHLVWPTPDGRNETKQSGKHADA